MYKIISIFFQRYFRMALLTIGSICQELVKNSFMLSAFNSFVENTTLPSLLKSQFQTKQVTFSALEVNVSL